MTYGSYDSIIRAFATTSGVVNVDAGERVALPFWMREEKKLRVSRQTVDGPVSWCHPENSNLLTSFCTSILFCMMPGSSNSVHRSNNLVSNASLAAS